MRWLPCLIALSLAAPAAAGPRSDYLLHCAGCHRPDGTGLPPGVPSLVGPLGSIAATPQGRDYLARVPGAAQAPLSDEELTAVLNWVLLELNAPTLPESFRPLEPREVGRSRSRVLADPLKLRSELWPTYTSVALAGVDLAGLALPDELPTYGDGRKPIGDLYRGYLSLLDRGWELDVVAWSQPGGVGTALPIIALRTPQTGETAWILSGIHGEETAGPNAIAEAIDTLAELGRTRPVVLLPLNNPHGYARNWRYLNTPTYSAEIDGQSVGDSSHLLPDPEHVGNARAPAPSSAEADAITAYILEQAERYPPRWSIDLHEDNLIDEGYVYSQGVLGADDPLAGHAVRLLREHGIPIKRDGETRFGEPIVDGIIGPVVDSSIDELMSAPAVIVDGQEQAGPHAGTVLVFETPAAAIDLPRRVAAHAALLRMLAGELAEENAGEPGGEP